ncbi:hypothetical protein L2E82_27107 [Cichorium intybus]|uniref:Uncharacterized protein n=1 Tax=Cichorium intybus TaxID=13427 RepID=A0ACB9CSQ1_CICIN|nr:hypothetical protein L2E82_27107 [Cichorium intybus]
MAPSRANREKTAKACKAMKPFGISAETIKSSLKRLLEAYENNWTYIEEDNYRVLLDAIFAPEEEAEPLEKKARLENQTGFTSPSGTSVPCSVNYASEIQQTAETDIETMNIQEDDKFKGKKPMPQFEIPLAVIHPAPPRDLCDDDSMDLEDENLDGKENEDENENENEIDLASYCNGDVKLSFCICKPPEGFCIPSVDAVMKQVEDRYKERFNHLGTEFSLSGLLKDICETLVKQGDVSDN